MKGKKKMPRSPIQVINDPRFLEKIARIEHKHWMMTIESLVNGGKISPNDLGEISKHLVDYDALPESAKEQRREWAWRVIKEIAVSLLTEEMVPDQYGG